MNGKSCLWRDQRAAVISTELILVTAVVVVGSLSGLQSVRETMVDSYSNVVKTVHSASQSYFDEAQTLASDDDRYLSDTGHDLNHAVCTSVYNPLDAHGS